MYAGINVSLIIGKENIMNFRTKLKLLSFVTVIGLSLLGILSVTGLDSIIESENTAHRRKGYVIDLLEIKASAVSTIMLDPSLPETKEVFADAEKHIEINGKESLSAIKRLQIVEELKQILALWEHYDQSSQELIKLSATDFPSANAKLIPLYNLEFKPFQEKLDQFIFVRQQEAAQSRAEASETAKNVFWEVVGLLGLVALVNISVVLQLSHSLRKGLHDIHEKLIPLKKGDLTQRLPTRNQDELAEISIGVNEFICELQNIVETVRNDADQVANAAVQLALASEHVLVGSNRQSQATSSVAATIEQFSVSIDQVSNNATLTEQQASLYGDLSRQGGNDVQIAIEEIRRIERAVNNAVEKMQVLGDQAHQISSIVNVIKEVADQTNLLALNAAIEAARAGESGRGFSVVADEVRNLAERTAKSAQEITSMIKAIQSHTETAANVMQQGNERVMAGVKQAEQAGNSMQLINDNSITVMRSISDISTALREQRIASNDISKNVELISQMTEENNAAVSEVSTASLRLEELAGQLKEGVAKFKV